MNIKARVARIKLLKKLAKSYDLANKRVKSCVNSKRRWRKRRPKIRMVKQNVERDKSRDVVDKD